MSAYHSFTIVPDITLHSSNDNKHLVQVLLIYLMVFTRVCGVWECTNHESLKRLKKADKEGSLSEQFYKIFTVKENVHATRENNGEQRTKPKPIEVAGVKGRRGDVRAREENMVRKRQQAQGIKVQNINRLIILILALPMLTLLLKVQQPQKHVLFCCTPPDKNSKLEEVHSLV